MTTLRFLIQDGHCFLESSGALWLIDTGAPSSFGSSQSLTLAGQSFSLSREYPGLTVASLSDYVGVDCVGLLGADVLGCFDMLFDALNSSITLSTTDLELDGHHERLEMFMGIPIVSARIDGNSYRMFFDTGAQISYFQSDSIPEFPAAGSVNDFYPGFGKFETQTHSVRMELGPVEFDLRSGTLPGLLGATLMMAGTRGIVGNQILENGVVGYFPRRRLLVLPLASVGDRVAGPASAGFPDVASDAS